MNTIWMTGISGVGKTTIARGVKKTKLKDVIILEGDILRLGVCADLGFSIEDRERNVKRAAHICKMLNDEGHLVIACLNSPMENHRQIAKKIIGENNFFLTYVSCDLATLRKRDPKDLYAQYDAGMIKNMLGLDLPYEPPEKPNLTLNTAFFSEENCIGHLVRAYAQWKIKKDRNEYSSSL
jgi:adenylyl-sulfate kinase